MKIFLLFTTIIATCAADEPKTAALHLANPDDVNQIILKSTQMPSLLSNAFENPLKSAFFDFTLKSKSKLTPSEHRLVKSIEHLLRDIQKLETDVIEEMGSLWAEIKLETVKALNWMNVPAIFIEAKKLDEEYMTAIQAAKSSVNTMKAKMFEARKKVVNARANQVKNIAPKFTEILDQSDVGERSKIFDQLMEELRHQKELKETIGLITDFQNEVAKYRIFYNKLRNVVKEYNTDPLSRY